jgi:hypothetical protein
MQQENPNYSATIRTVLAAIASELRVEKARAKQPKTITRAKARNETPEPCCTPACCFA